MFHRLYILTILQLSNKTRRFEKNSKRIYAFIALRILSIVIITVLMSLMLYLLTDLFYIPVNHYLMIFMLIVTQIMNILSALSGLTVDIYQSKDNQILFTFPAKNDEIFLSKLIVYYIYEFIKNLYFIFPFLIAYGYNTNAGFTYYTSIIPIIFVIPFIAVFFSSFLSIILAFIKNYFLRHVFVKFALIVTSIIGLFILVYFLAGFIPDTIRIVQLYNSFIINLMKFMQSVSDYGTIYSIIGELMNGINILKNLFIILLVVISLFLINYLISRPLFFYLTGKSSEPAGKKKHNIKQAKYKGLFWTFLRKEITIMKRSPNELLNNYAILISLPVIMFTINKIYMGMDRSSLGNNLVLVFNIFITLMIISASNTASAAAITTEGFEFVLLKSAPSKTHQVAWAKMIFNILITSILLILSFVLFQLALPVFNKTNIWLLFTFTFFYNISHILWSFQLDILSPKLADYAATGSLSNNENIAQSLSGGLLLSVFFTLLSAVLFIFISEIAWFVLIAIIILLFIFRLLTFRAYLKAYFTDIEY